MNEWLAIAAGGMLSPVITALVKKIPAVEEAGADKLGAAINLGVCTLLFVLAGAVLPRAYPELPPDLETWVRMGLAAGGAGNAGNNIYRKTVAKGPRARARSRSRRS